MAKHPEIKNPGTEVKTPIEKKRVTLLDALDKVLEKGAVVNGDVLIRVADVDLVHLGLQVLLCSISKAEELSEKSLSNPRKKPTKKELEYLAKLEREIKKTEANIPKLIDAKNPTETEKGIAKLVLTLVELLRRLMEREVVRRISKGSLSDIKIQKLGMTFKALKKKTEELKIVFGIQDEELNLDLGPLGNLM